MLVSRAGLHGRLHKLEDDRFKVEVVDGGGLDLAPELDVVFLVLLEDEAVEVLLGGHVLRLDLLVHLLEPLDHQLEHLLLLAVHHVLLGDHEVLARFQRVHDLLHVLGQQEGEHGRVLVLRDLERLDEHFREEDDFLAALQEGAERGVLVPAAGPEAGALFRLVFGRGQRRAEPVEIGRVVAFQPQAGWLGLVLEKGVLALDGEGLVHRVFLGLEGSVLGVLAPIWLLEPALEAVRVLRGGRG